jgi:hypothetical protein
MDEVCLQKIRNVFGQDNRIGAPKIPVQFMMFPYMCV